MNINFMLLRTNIGRLRLATLEIVLDRRGFYVRKKKSHFIRFTFMRRFMLGSVDSVTSDDRLVCAQVVI